jgi:hypothetical protein
MLHGSSKRQTATWLALIVSTAAGAVACQRPLLSQAGFEALSTPLPVTTKPRVVTDVQTPAVQPRAKIQTASNVTTSPPARLIVQAPPEPEPAPAPAPAPAPKPTPTLDAMVKKTEALKEAALDAMSEPEPKPDEKDTPKPNIAEASKLDLPKADPPKDDDRPGDLVLPLAKKEPEPAKTPKIDPERPSAPTKPEDIWREGLEQLRVLALEHRGGSGASDDWSIRAQLLELLAKPDLESGSRGSWRTVVRALSEANAPGPSDDHARATTIRAAVQTLEEHLPLEITDLRLCRKVTGFASFEPLENAECKAGRDVIVYCEMAGMHYEASADEFHSRIAGQVEIRTAKGDKTLWSRPLGTAEDFCSRKRRDYYVNYRVTVPKTLAPGAYQLRLTEKDLNSDQTTSLAIPLILVP